MAYKLNPGDVAVVLSPGTDADNEWDGTINIGISFGKEAISAGQREALDMALTMSVLQHVIDDYPDLEYEFDHYKADLLRTIFPEQYAEAEKQIQETEYDSSVEVKGNVYTLNAWSKTEGSA